MAGFSPRKEITTIKNLFGRNILFQQLISLANNKHSVSITGLRRFGKTCILKSIETSLRDNAESDIYPLYFDFKEVGSTIKGTDNVYRYMISLLTARLFHDNYFRENVTFRNISITPSNNWENVFENIEHINSVRIQGLFEDIIIFFSELLNKTVLFLVDEYEWLFRFSFDSPVGFMKLRNLSSKTLLDGSSPFCFWIAGSVTWENLCSITGSGELNVIDAPPIYLSSIDHESFKEMWDNEVSNLKNYPKQISEAIDFAFKASGGIPFYGKLIGGYILSTQTFPSYFLLKSYFHEIFESLRNEEKIILMELAKAPKSIPNSKFAFELINKGLIEKKGTMYIIKSGFFKDFLNASQNITENSSSNAIPESQKITDRITHLITNINNTNKNKRGEYIFEPVVDEAALIKDLRTPCYSLDLFSDFASSLYKIVFERTKKTHHGSDVSKGRLPDIFKKNNKFINVVDIMRHSLGGGHLMDVFSQRKNKLSKPEMLNILVGSKNEPHTPEDFYSLQLASLTMFEQELIKLNTIVRA